MIIFDTHYDSGSLKKIKNETRKIGLVFWTISRDSPVSVYIYLPGQHIHLVSKYLTSDKRFGTLSRTISQATKQIQFD